MITYSFTVKGLSQPESKYKKSQSRKIMIPWNRIKRTKKSMYQSLTGGEKERYKMITFHQEYLNFKQTNKNLQD